MYFTWNYLRSIWKVEAGFKIYEQKNKPLDPTTAFSFRWGRNHESYWKGPSCILYNEVSFLLCLYVMQVCRPQETDATESKLNSFLYTKTRNAETTSEQPSPITHDDFIEGDEDPFVWFTVANKTRNYFWISHFGSSWKIPGKHRKLRFISTSVYREFKAL